jgi:hypothetical protein
VLHSNPGYFVCGGSEIWNATMIVVSGGHLLARKLHLMLCLVGLFFFAISSSRLFHTLANAQSYEEWEEAAFELDELQSKDIWYGIEPPISASSRPRIRR